MKKQSGGISNGKREGGKRDGQKMIMTKVKGCKRERKESKRPTARERERGRDWG